MTDPATTPVPPGAPDHSASPVPPPADEAATTAAPAEAPPAEPPAEGSAPHRRRAVAIAVAVVIVVVVLAAGGGVLWLMHPAPGIDAARFAVLAHQVQALDARVTLLESRPASPAVDAAALNARIAALELRPPSELGSAPADLSGLTSRLSADEQHLAEARAAAEHTAALERAALLLAAGRPLGAIPGAPPALARFATEVPPTEAALRLDFPAAARRAEAASRPDTSGQPLVERMWQSVRSLVRISNESGVIVGAPAAVTLGRAQALLTVGDLAGAVAALAPLDAAAAHEMAEWRARAEALLAARAALADMLAASGR
jgi:hypothetical protein